MAWYWAEGKGEKTQAEWVLVAQELGTEEWEQAQVDKQELHTFQQDSPVLQYRIQCSRMSLGGCSLWKEMHQKSNIHLGCPLAE